MGKFLIEATELVRWEGYVKADTQHEAYEKFLRILQQEDNPSEHIEDLFNDSDGLEINMLVEVEDDEE